MKRKINQDNKTHHCALLEQPWQLGRFWLDVERAGRTWAADVQPLSSSQPVVGRGQQPKADREAVPVRSTSTTKPGLGSASTSLHVLSKIICCSMQLDHHHPQPTSYH